MASQMPGHNATLSFQGYNFGDNDAAAEYHQQSMEEYLAATQAARSGNVWLQAFGNGRPWYAALGLVLAMVTTGLGAGATVGLLILDASAKTSDTSAIPDEGIVDDEEDIVERMRLLLRRAAANQSSDVVGDASGNSVNATYQWVNGTDVIDSPVGQASTISFHILTTLLLFVLLTSQIQLWRHRLHASSLMVMGLIQLWVGLSILSRSFDSYSQSASYTLLAVGLTSFFIGISARFQSGGPGTSLFETGKTNWELQNAYVGQQQYPEAMEGRVQADGGQASLMGAASEKAQLAAAMGQTEGMPPAGFNGQAGYYSQVGNAAAPVTPGNVGIPVTPMGAPQYQQQMAATPAPMPFAGQQQQQVPHQPAMAPTVMAASGYSTEPMTATPPPPGAGYTNTTTWQSPHTILGNPFHPTPTVRPSSAMSGGSAGNQKLPTRTPPAYLLSNPLSEKLQNKQWKSRMMYAAMEQQQPQQ